MAVKNFFINIFKNIKLIFSYFKLNIKKEWKYKSSFFMQIIMMILNDAFFIIQWVVIFSLVPDIGGYGFNEVMLIWACMAGSYGVARVFFGGAWNISDMVYNGDLDVYMNQPKSVLINASCSSTDISALGDILYSYVVLFIVKAPWQWFVLMPIISVISGLIYVSAYIVYTSFSFYIKRGNALARAYDTTITKVDNYPPHIFSSAIKWIILTIIPASLCTFVPVQYILLTPNIWWILIYAGAMFVWIILAFLSFKIGLRRYNSGNLMSGRL